MKEIKFLKFVCKVDSFGDPIYILFDIGSSLYNLYDPVEKKIICEGFPSASEARLAALKCFKLLSGFWTCNQKTPFP